MTTMPDPASCAGCGGPLRRRKIAWCWRCEQERVKALCPGCGRLRLLAPETGRCVICSRTCADCGKVVRPQGRDRCSRCHRRGNPSRACRACGKPSLIVAHGLCDNCWQQDPARLAGQVARLAARLDDPPGWLADFAAHAEARHCVGRTSLMISRLGRLLAETGTAAPQALLEKASRPGRSAGTLARALEDFFTDAGLAFPADHAARREAARRQRRVEETQQPLRPAVARYAAAQVTAQQRARRARTRPRADRTLADELAVLRDLARFLTAERAKTNWATVQAADLEAFLALRPASQARRLTILRSFFRWAKASRLVLANPAAGLSARQRRGYHPRTLAVAEQRRLFRRWTTGPAVHPHEALTGLLALLHAAPSRELRHLTITDIDTTARTVRLGRRPHPVPLDPATWHALQRCLEHRERLATRNPHVIVTAHTRTRRTPASDQYLVRVMDPAGIGTKTLRATRIVDLVASLDPKLVCEALGMDPAGVLPYAADQVQDTRLADL
jgi:site-specific recombinase XerD